MNSSPAAAGVPVERAVARAIRGAAHTDDALARALAAIGEALGLEQVLVVENDGGRERWRRDGASAGDSPSFEFPARSERGTLARVECFGPGPSASLEVVEVQLGQLLERRRVEHSSDVAELRHRATLRAALDCVITIDHEGSVLEFNPAAERTFGYASEAAVGREMAELIVPPEMRERHRAGLRRYLEGGEPILLDRRVEVEAQRADGSRFPAELTITRIEVPGEPVFTGHLRDITERRAAEHQLRQSRTRLVEAAYEARRRIERDLHDGAQQQLVSVAMTLQGARGSLEREPAAAAELLDEAIAELRAATAELRELARGIHPAVLTEGGLDPALRGLVRRSPLAAKIAAVPAERFPAAVEAAAYFVVAEGLTNAARHAAGASLVEVEVVAGEGRLEVAVRDDGPGGASLGGGGLGGLADRVAALGGELAIASPVGAGTTLSAGIPCE
ncbi:MAG: PAS domain S-box protein [Actinobacteria bacterium]|nr:PAS domain S-box protein [Actinomycetota bacterium]